MSPRGTLDQCRDRCEDKYADWWHEFQGATLLDHCLDRCDERFAEGVEPAYDTPLLLDHTPANSDGSPNFNTTAYIAPHRPRPAGRKS